MIFQWDTPCDDLWPHTNMCSAVNLVPFCTECRLKMLENTWSCWSCVFNPSLLVIKMLCFYSGSGNLYNSHFYSYLTLSSSTFVLFISFFPLPLLSLWWMICIILQAAIAWFHSLNCEHLSKLFIVQSTCLETYKSCFTIEEEDVCDPSLINKHQMKSGRSSRAKMWDCCVTFESSEKTDCLPLACQSQPQWLTAESCSLSTQTTSNIHPFSIPTSAGS